MPPDHPGERPRVAARDAASGGVARGETTASRDIDDTAFERALLTPALRWRLELVSRRILSDRHEAEDVAQEAITTAWCRADSLRSLEQLDGWVITIARNLAIDRCRGRFSPERRPRYVAEWSDRYAAEPRCTRVAPGAGGLVLAEALASLAESERRGLERRLYGYSYREIARLESTTVAAIKSRMYRARRKFEEVLL